MQSAIDIQRYLSINQGRYLRESLYLKRMDCTVYVTTHEETAKTDLLHYHAEPHMSFVLSGGVIDKRRSTETERVACDLMYFDAGEIHQSLYRQFPVRSLNIEFGSGGPDVTGNAHAKFSLLKIYKEMLIGDASSLESIEMLMLGLESSADDKLSPPKWLRTLEEMLRDRWNDQFSVDDLAAAAGVHPKTISKAFPKYFGLTYGEYRRVLRIERALSMIRTKDLSLTDVAYRCGFYDQSHFISTFKRLTGFLPNQFRRI